MNYTLGKDEKLKSKIFIGQLFEKGNRVKSFPLQLIYLSVNHNANFPVKVGFSVPKRNIKLAVNRIKIKRLMREVYRKNKHVFADNLKEKHVFMFIYMTKNEPKYTDLEIAFEKLTTKFLNKIKDDEKV